MVKRFLEDKRLILFLSLLGVISLVALGGALNNITFESAKPLYHEETVQQAGDFSLAQTIETFANIPVWKQFAFFAAIFLILVLAFWLLSPETRKRLLRMFLRGALALLILYFLIKKNPELFQEMFPLFDFSDNGVDVTALEDIAPPVFEPPQVSETFSFLITLVIVLVIATIAWRFYLWRKEQNDALNVKHPLDEIAKIARTSLNELSRQGASQDAIIRCYENMSQAVFARRGLQRSYVMPAAEFAQKLEHAGLPHEPVNRLTRLFESARYGSHLSTQSDIDEAVSCLTSILKSCGENL